MTYTYARLPLSPEAYDEIATKLKEAGYHHAFENNGDIDMHGIGLCVEEQDRHAALLGSDWQPSMVTINENSTVQLGDVVRFAFERAGVTLKQWNRLPCRVREVLLIEAITTMKEEARDG
jgi:glucosamine 6-phosphate synthetase-like amidotransferase/phosphosugar isomerase protein